MRQYSLNEIRAALKDGLKFVVPFSEKPSRYPPFRAIVEAAGIPGVSEGKGKVSRKRFIRLVMSTGNQIRAAEYLAYAAHRNGVSYRECLQRTMIPEICQADAFMERVRQGMTLELVSDTPEDMQQQVCGRA